MTLYVSSAVSERTAAAVAVVEYAPQLAEVTDEQAVVIGRVDPLLDELQEGAQTTIVRVEAEGEAPRLLAIHPFYMNRVDHSTSRGDRYGVWQLTEYGSEGERVVVSRVERVRSVQGPRYTFTVRDPQTRTSRRATATEIADLVDMFGRVADRRHTTLALQAEQAAKERQKAGRHPNIVSALAGLVGVQIKNGR